MLQYINGECEVHSVIGDRRMAALAILGEVLEDLSLEELISYHGQSPVWKRILVSINAIRVSLTVEQTKVHRVKLGRATNKVNAKSVQMPFYCQLVGGVHGNECKLLVRHICVVIFHANCINFISMWYQRYQPWLSYPLINRKHL